MESEREKREKYKHKSNIGVLNTICYECNGWTGNGDWALDVCGRQRRSAAKHAVAREG